MACGVHLVSKSSVISVLPALAKAEIGYRLNLHGSKSQGQEH